MLIITLLLGLLSVVLLIYLLLKMAKLTEDVSQKWTTTLIIYLTKSHISLI